MYLWFNCPMDIIVPATILLYKTFRGKWLTLVFGQFYESRVQYLIKVQFSRLYTGKDNNKQFIVTKVLSYSFTSIQLLYNCVKRLQQNSIVFELKLSYCYLNGTN